MKMTLGRALLSLAATTFAFAAGPASATGLATCDSGPKEGWQPQAKLEKQLTDQKWQVRRIKVDGGCYEVYAVDKAGKKVNLAYNAETLEKLDNAEAGEN